MPYTTRDAKRLFYLATRNAKRAIVVLIVICRVSGLAPARLQARASAPESLLTSPARGSGLREPSKRFDFISHNSPKPGIVKTKTKTWYYSPVQKINVQKNSGEHDESVG